MVEVLDAQAADVVDEDEGHHDREKPYLAPAVEHQTAEEQHGVLELCGRKVIQRQRDGQKPEQKDDGAENQSVSLLLAEKADAANGTGLGWIQIQSASALSTALSRSAVHSLDAITMTMVLPLKAMTAFSTLSCA